MMLLPTLREYSGFGPSPNGTIYPLSIIFDLGYKFSGKNNGVFTFIPKSIKHLKNGENMTTEQLKEYGLNHSLVHTDFMIGNSDLKIIGTTFDGRDFVVFENGNFVLK